MTRQDPPHATLYKLALEERRRVASEHFAIDLEELANCLDCGGLEPATADKIVENVLGTYALPFGVAPHFVVNGRRLWVPMVVEEPSVIAAASSAAKRISLGGGFSASVVDRLMTVQIEIHAVDDEQRACKDILAQSEELLRMASEQVPNLVARGGGPRELEVRPLGQGFVVVHMHVDCRDAMGANLVNTIGEGIGPRIAQLGQGTLGLRILTNLCDRRRVRVECRVPAEGLVRRRADDSPPLGAADLRNQAVVIAESMEQASRFAELDPYRAATHNKGIMNGIDSVVIATGNDYRAVEAGAHAYAARSGNYRPLAIWRRRGEELHGCIELPLALGIVGGTLRVHPAAKLALRMLGVRSAGELAQVAAATGLASNFAALLALVTDGIQKGHMALHARGVATQAGALGAEVERVANELARSQRFDLETARLALERLRSTGAAS